MAAIDGSQFVYNSQLDAFTLYHTVQEEAGNRSGFAGGPVLPALGHATAGSLATATSKVLLYPLDLVITRMQVQRQLRGPRETASAASEAGAEYNSLLDAARKIYETEGGLKAFYTGCGPDAAKSIADSFLFFLIYTFLRQHQMRKDGTKHLTVSKELLVGIGAGAMSRFVTTPIQNIVTRQQTAALVAARDPTSTTKPGESAKLSVKDIALQIRSERGIKGFWAGYSASTLLTINPSITFALHSFLERLLPRTKREKPPPYLTFLIAALSKAIATAITYPVSLAKSRAQVGTSSSTAKAEGTEDSEEVSEGLEKKSLNSTPRRRQVKRGLAKSLLMMNAQYRIFMSLRQIYLKEGLQGLYSGLEAEVLKGFLSHGLTMVMKDSVHIGVIQLYYVLLKLTKQWPTGLENMKDGVQELASDARDRAGNIVETVAEGTKQAFEDGKKAVGA